VPQCPGRLWEVATIYPVGSLFHSSGQGSRGVKLITPLHLVPCYKCVYTYAAHISHGMLLLLSPGVCIFSYLVLKRIQIVVSACQCVRNKSSSNSHSTGTWKIREECYTNASLVTIIHSCNGFGSDTVPKSGTELCALRLAILTEICRGFTQHSLKNIRDIALNLATMSI
jgi:hypothetical protein